MKFSYIVLAVIAALSAVDAACPSACNTNPNNFLCKLFHCPAKAPTTGSGSTGTGTGSGSSQTGSGGSTTTTFGTGITISPTTATTSPGQHISFTCNFVNTGATTNNGFIELQASGANSASADTSGGSNNNSSNGNGVSVNSNIGTWFNGQREYIDATLAWPRTGTFTVTCSDSVTSQTAVATVHVQ